MKKTLALLAVAAMMFSAGCGGQKAADDAANSAVEKVEQTATNAKDAATDAVNTAVEKMTVTVQDATAVMDKIKAGDKTGIALGGLVPGVNLELATEMYGEPVVTEGDVLGFSNGLDAKVKNNTIEEISTSYEGIPTPAGIEVGMADVSLNDVDVYGTATSVEERDGATIYKYLSPDKRWAISFSTRDGVIDSISCGLNQ